MIDVEFTSKKNGATRFFDDVISITVHNEKNITKYDFPETIMSDRSNLQATSFEIVSDGGSHTHLLGGEWFPSHAHSS